MSSGAFAVGNVSTDLLQIDFDAIFSHSNRILGSDRGFAFVEMNLNQFRSCHLSHASLRGCFRISVRLAHTGQAADLV